MKSQWTVSIILKNSLIKRLVTANSVFVYKLKDPFRTLKPFCYYIISHYKTQNKKALFLVKSPSFCFRYLTHADMHTCRLSTACLRKAGCRDPLLRIWGTSVSSNIRSTHSSLPEHTPHEPEV